MSADRRRPFAWLGAAIVIGVAASLVLRFRGGSVSPDVERATGPASDRPPAPIEAPELAASGAGAPSAARSGMGAEGPPEAAATASAPTPVTHVDFVDAETGARIPGCELAPTGAPLELSWTVEAREALAPDVIISGEPRILRSGEASRRSFSTNRFRRGAFVPDGCVLVAHPELDTVLARHATSFRVVQPVHREVSVRVTFVDGAGMPSRGGSVHAWRVGEVFSGSPIVELTPDGSVRLRGVPFIRGALLRLQCARASEDEKALEVPPIPEELEVAWFESPFQWPIPSSPDGTIDARIPIASLSDAVIEDHFESECDLATTIVATTQEPTFGSIRVELRGLDGRPLNDVPVAVHGSSGTTDQAGIATLVGVPAGSRDITVHDAGRLFERATATVVADAETRLTVHEIEGGTLEIEVVDSEGSPAPFARIAIRPEQGLTWIDINDAGEQRLDPFTDARGRRTCARIAPGKVTVLARHGDGQAKDEVELRDGQRRTLRLELK